MTDYQQMARVLAYLNHHADHQPTLDDLARFAGMSPCHFQRKFSHWVGVSPKAYLACMTLENARAILETGRSVLAASLDTGLSSPGRLHDLCIRLDAASPGEIKTGGRGLDIHYGFGLTPFGECLLANSPRGICHLAFIDPGDRESSVNELLQRWPGGRFIVCKHETRAIIDDIFNPAKRAGSTGLRAYVSATRFQVLVWRALIRVPAGEAISYRALAETINRPRSARAVGNAVAANPLAYLIPCHRVIRQSGVIGDYRWGSQRKKALLVYEGMHSPGH